MRALFWISRNSSEEGNALYIKNNTLCSEKLASIESVLSNDAFSELIFLIPGMHFNCMSFKSTERNNAKRLGLFLGSFGHEIIKLPSELSFEYSQTQQAYYWIDKNYLAKLSKKFEGYGKEVYLIPDYFILEDIAPSAFKLNDGEYIAMLSNGEGITFKAEDNLHNLFDFSTQDASSSDDNEFLLSLDKLSSINELSDDFICNKLLGDFPSINFHKNKFSYKKVLSYIGLSVRASFIYSGLLAFGILIGLIDNFLLEQNIKDNRQEIISIFKEINPNFRRLVNARAQIDDLVNLEEYEYTNFRNSIDILKENLPLLLNLDFDDATYDAKQNLVSITFSELSKTKKISLEGLLLTQGLEYSFSNLDEDRNIFSGVITIEL